MDFSIGGASANSKIEASLISHNNESNSKIDPIQIQINYNKMEYFEACKTNNLEIIDKLFEKYELIFKYFEKVKLIAFSNHHNDLIKKINKFHNEFKEKIVKDDNIDIFKKIYKINDNEYYFELAAYNNSIKIFKYLYDLDWFHVGKKYHNAYNIAITYGHKEIILFYFEKYNRYIECRKRDSDYYDGSPIYNSTHYKIEHCQYLRLNQDVLKLIKSRLHKNCIDCLIHYNLEN
jgi:hypothetical protein